MARDFQIYGECLVRVRGTGALGQRAEDSIFSLAGFPETWELGLTDEHGIRITPRYIYTDIPSDSFGGRRGPPAERMWTLCDVRVQMRLIHYDSDVLERCLANSMGGYDNVFDGNHTLDRFSAGRFVSSAGKLMGNNQPSTGLKHHYIRLNIAGPNKEPWRFFHAYLSEQPVEIPMGSEASVVALQWTAVPFVQQLPPTNPAQGEIGGGSDVSTEGAAIWDHGAD